VGRGFAESDASLRAFHHPAEPLYLAAWMKYAPGLLTLAHLPVLIAAILGVTYMGLVVGGNRIGLLTGILACLHPFLRYTG
jgi:hypothetical protein